jgi:hypothetical protein
VASLSDARLALAQSDASVSLIVPSGRALRVALRENTTVHRIGQVVTAQLVEPVYAYDRVVLPVGRPGADHEADTAFETQSPPVDDQRRFLTASRSRDPIRADIA